MTGTASESTICTSLTKGAVRNEKLIFLLIFILAAGISIYYLASVQVQPGHVSVVYSGLSGLLPDIHSKEGRHFIAQRLIPGDTEIYTYPKTAHSISRSGVFYLPPGKLPVFDRKKDFEVRTVISLQLKMGKKSPLLLAAAGYHNIEAFTSRVMERTKIRVREALTLAADAAIRTGKAPDLAGAIKNALQQDFLEKEKKSATVYGIELTGLSVNAASLPDAATYIQLRRSLAKTHPELAVRLRKHYRDRALLIRLQKKNDEELRRLTGIAKLVTRYPGLIDYMAVVKLSKRLRVAMIPGNGDSMKAGIYKKLVDRMLKSLPAARPVNVNIKNGQPPQPAKTTATNR